MTIVIIGASAGPGRLLFERLRDQGKSVTGIARTSRDIQTSGNAQFQTLDVANATDTASLIQSGDVVIHCSRPELLTGLIKHMGDISRLIAIGSTRIYTRFPDDKCARLTEMTHHIGMSDLPATILHPTMIYGAPGLNNLERVARYAHLSPFIPLPGGGTALIQPVHAHDVVDAILACLDDNGTIGRTIVTPGGRAISYREFVNRCITQSGANCRVTSLPYWILSIVGFLTPLIPLVPTVTHEEIRRLLEDKAFSSDQFESLVGRKPREFLEPPDQI